MGWIGLRIFLTGRLSQYGHLMGLLRRPPSALTSRSSFLLASSVQASKGSSASAAMATTAAGYGCCSVGLPPFALLPGILSTRRHPPPPPRVSLVASSSKLRAPAPRLRASYRPRSLTSSSGEVNSDAVPSPTEATIDIKLPRRSLLVQFTCNACGERTKRLINRVAYERGTIFLQCAGCQVYHKFVDNLGLVVEYDLREENELQGENVVNTNSED